MYIEKMPPLRGGISNLFDFDCYYWPYFLNESTWS